MDSLYPEYKIWEQYTIDSFGAAQRLDALRTSHPIIVPIKHAEEVEQVCHTIYEDSHTVYEDNHTIYEDNISIYEDNHTIY